LKLSRLLSLSLAAVGSSASARVLQRRHEWEQLNNRVAICVDYDDAYSAAIRAGMSFDDLLHEASHHGATHISLPELTLNRLRTLGRLTPQVPSSPIQSSPRVGHWNYLHGDPLLVKQLVPELLARVPYTQARLIDQHTLAFAGDLPTIGEIGLGFDAFMAQRIKSFGLDVVPRPVSYAWPEDDLINLTLAQASVFGKLIAFDGDMILGHEMHLQTTFDAMEREGLTLVYFAESRHQKGDWFVAKRRAPHVVLAHRFTPQEMIPLDFHAAAHYWAHLARERGIRFCYVNFFKVLHATAPLEGLHYIEHIKEALEHDGFVVTKDVCLPTPIPAPTKEELSWIGLTSGAAASSAVASALKLPDFAALPLTIVGTGVGAMLPHYEKARNELEEHYAPSYAPKLIALAASLAPIASLNVNDESDWLSGALLQGAAASAMAASTSGGDYHLRIEEYRGFGLDWFAPFAVAASTIPNKGLRIAALTTLSGLWFYMSQRGIDPFARFDPAHAEGHTHHLSAAARMMGDAKIALGPQPSRKWFGLGAFASALSLVFASNGQKSLASVAALASATGNTMGLVAFRRPERALKVTLKESLPSLGAGVALGVVMVMMKRK